MRVCALGSGSAGNALLVEGPRGLLLVDAGLPWRDLRARAGRVGFSLEGLRWAVVTHEHADHVRGLEPLLRRGVQIAASAGTLRALGIAGTPLQPGLELAGIKLFSFPVSHDAAQPVGLMLEVNGARVGIATDLGQVTESVLSSLRGCQVLVVEANHDLGMLLAGPYPWPLKLRILGPEGHLANDEAGRALTLLRGDGLRAVLLAHLSQENNTPALALETVARALPGWDGHLYLTYPDRPSAVVSS
ncbi:MAG: MBL fold metallo-hydrolase [Candidatus Acetothermia bacterium]|nr:MBL fold metallo-hydrolase [Candidatus Acetothermia bacterium]